MANVSAEGARKRLMIFETDRQANITGIQAERDRYAVYQKFRLSERYLPARRRRRTLLDDVLG